MDILYFSELRSNYIKESVCEFKAYMVILYRGPQTTSLLLASWLYIGQNCSPSAH